MGGVCSSFKASDIINDDYCGRSVQQKEPHTVPPTGLKSDKHCCIEDTTKPCAHDAALGAMPTLAVDVRTDSALALLLEYARYNTHALSINVTLYYPQQTVGMKLEPGYEQDEACGVPYDAQTDQDAEGPYCWPESEDDRYKKRNLWKKLRREQISLQLEPLRMPEFDAVLGRQASDLTDNTEWEAEDSSGNQPRRRKSSQKISSSRTESTARSAGSHLHIASSGCLSTGQPPKHLRLSTASGPEARSAEPFESMHDFKESYDEKVAVWEAWEEELVGTAGPGDRKPQVNIDTGVHSPREETPSRLEKNVSRWEDDRTASATLLDSMVGEQSSEEQGGRIAESARPPPPATGHGSSQDARSASPVEASPKPCDRPASYTEAASTATATGAPAADKERATAASSRSPRGVQKRVPAAEAAGASFPSAENASGKSRVQLPGSCGDPHESPQDRVPRPGIQVLCGSPERGSSQEGVMMLPGQTSMASSLASQLGSSELTPTSGSIASLEREVDRLKELYGNQSSCHSPGQGSTLADSRFSYSRYS